MHECSEKNTVNSKDSENVIERIEPPKVILQKSFKSLPPIDPKSLKSRDSILPPGNSPLLFQIF